MATAPDAGYQEQLDALTQLHRAREIEQAQAGYRRMIEQYPASGELHYRLGLTHHQLDEELEALVALDTAIGLCPGDARFLNLRGNVYHTLQDHSASHRDYLRATELDPSYALAFNNLGLSLKALAQYEKAVAAFHEATRLQPDYSDAFFNFASALEAAGDTLGAINALQRCLEINHADQEAMLRLAILSGNQDEHAPERLIEGMFDQYAPSFEDHLQQELGYRTPTELTALLNRHLENQQLSVALDLGCGTGLAGLAIRNQVQTLVGVDLSSKMLEQAAQKGCYDDLAQAELVAYLDSSDIAFDLFISSDVLVYIGDLAPLFQSMARRASQDAWCLISTEISQEPGYHFQQSARYAHHPDYVRETATAAGFEMIECQKAPLRRDLEDWIQGNLFLFRRLTP